VLRTEVVDARDAHEGEGAFDLAAQDVLAIIKGMVDAAGEQAERDQPALARRVGRAVFGYLDGAD